MWKIEVTLIIVNLSKKLWEVERKVIHILIKNILMQESKKEREKQCKTVLFGKGKNLILRLMTKCIKINKRVNREIRWTKANRKLKNSSNMKMMKISMNWLRSGYN